MEFKDVQFNVMGSEEIFSRTSEESIDGRYFLDQEQRNQQVQCIFSLILVDDGRVIDEGILKKEINEVQCIFQSGFSDDEKVIDTRILKVFYL